jgi:peptidoglycan/xylan/chitin deacetylase (PgdA/CDA1 family)
MKHAIISAGLSGLGATGLARLGSRWTRGLGAILMFHHVRPPTSRSFNPFGGLEITPQFLDAVLTHVRARGYEIIRMDEVPERLKHPAPQKPFVVLTFDDGYRDNTDHALPVLQRHSAPFTLYATTGFADGTASLWWLDMADAISGSEEVSCDGQKFPARTLAEKMTAYDKVHTLFLKQPETGQTRFVQNLLSGNVTPQTSWAKELCLDWDGLRKIASDPLCTLGAHTLTHPVLATIPAQSAYAEMKRSKSLLEERLGVEVRHMAYPVGNPEAAGPREFTMASEIGYKTAVTTRSGMLFPEHADHLNALPRLSVNGMHQSIRSFDALLTGLPFFLMNRGKRISVS